MKYVKMLICLGLGLGAVAPAMNAADFHRVEVRHDRRVAVRYERPVRYTRAICR